LRDASRALAVLRDADVLVLTAEDIRESSEPAEPNIVPVHLLWSLEEERGRQFAESGSPDGPLRAANELLSSVEVEIGQPKAPDVKTGHEPMTSSGTELIRVGRAASYASVRARYDPTVGEGPVDKGSHKLRKQVKNLRYQIELLDTGHPKFARLVRDLHHLTDLLGDRNNLATLAASADVVSEIERAALISHIDGLKQALQSGEATLSARLFEEEPDSFVARIEAWVTPPQG
jgi:CHAD domain-containing protein